MNRINNLVESNFGFNLTEQRIMHLACRQLRSIYMKLNIKSSEIRTTYKDKNFDLIQVYVLDYIRDLNVKGNNNYIVFADVAPSLNKKTISYLQSDGTYKDVRLGAFEYDKEKCCMNIMFNPEVIIDLLALKELYGPYKYITLTSFKRNAAFRLYEILKESAVAEKRTFALNELKEKLGLDSSMYQDFYEFKRSIILRAINEITKYTDIKNIKFESHTEARRVTSLSFKIEEIKLEDDIVQDPLYQVSTEELGRMSLVSGMNLTIKQAEKLIQAILMSVSKNKLDIGFYDYLTSLKETGAIYSLI